MRILALSTALLLALGPRVLAQGDCNDPAAGPDVIVGDLPEVEGYGTFAGISSFAVGTTSCNVGTEQLEWIDKSNRHPVIAQNLYRLADGRFEQLGMSWLKHGFGALQLDFCCDCAPSGSFELLGVGCSDPYTAGLNGFQPGIGPRYDVNGFTGEFSYPYSTIDQVGDIAFKRLQVVHSDLDPALHPGAQYYAEGHYVAPDDAAAGNGSNNASYRRVRVLDYTPQSVELTLVGTTVPESPAIRAWAAVDPAVTVADVPVPGEGLFLLGHRVSHNGDGTWHYEYALHNLNSDLAGGSFSVPVFDGVDLENIGFHGVERHSGDIHGRRTLGRRCPGGRRDLVDRGLRGRPERQRPALGHAVQLPLRRARSAGSGRGHAGALQAAHPAVPGRRRARSGCGDRWRPARRSASEPREPERLRARGPAALGERLEPERRSLRLPARRDRRLPPAGGRRRAGQHADRVRDAPLQRAPAGADSLEPCSRSAVPGPDSGELCLCGVPDLCPGGSVEGATIQLANALDLVLGTD